jgi:hypothetical protein
LTFAARLAASTSKGKARYAPPPQHLVSTVLKALAERIGYQQDLRCRQLEHGRRSTLILILILIAPVPSP